MVLTELSLKGVFLVSGPVFNDKRGFFRELYREETLSAAGIETRFVQDNLSVSRRSVIRGLHFQKAPHSQDKLVAVLSGRIWNVVADLRPDSPSFLRWTGIELSAERGEGLYIPAGFANGFASLEEDTIVFYKTSRPYKPESEAGIRWDDPALGIRWPFRDPILSDKDAGLPLFKES
jgi:dTDP-4-dehydrorhamnose 3,5-epimerase